MRLTVGVFFPALSRIDREKSSSDIPLKSHAKIDRKTRRQSKKNEFEGKVDSNKLYAIADALGLVQECATAKFDESIDVAVQLGIDAKKSDQVVRGAVVLPNGTGKVKRVAVFAQGAKAEEAKAAGVKNKNTSCKTHPDML